MDESEATAVLESHILSVCSAIGGVEETVGPNDSVLQSYVLGDESVGMQLQILLDQEYAPETYFNLSKI
jgi:hypothetical protein